MKLRTISMTATVNANSPIVVIKSYISTVATGTRKHFSLSYNSSISPSGPHLAQLLIFESHFHPKGACSSLSGSADASLAGGWMLVELNSSAKTEQAKKTPNPMPTVSIKANIIFSFLLADGSEPISATINAE